MLRLGFLEIHYIFLQVLALILCANITIINAISEQESKFSPLDEEIVVYNSTLPNHDHLHARDVNNGKPYYELHITTELRWIGCEWRKKVMINGQIPGPRLDFVEGTRTWVRVFNHLKVDAEVLTTDLMIHWHGLDVYPWVDGTALTQKPIKPGFYFDYAIEPKIGWAGSYLYHDHAQTFSTATATGELIVHPYNYDGRVIPPVEKIGAIVRNNVRVPLDTTIFISEFWEPSDRAIETNVKALEGKVRWSGEPAKILTNGNCWVHPYDQHSMCQTEIQPLYTDQWHRIRFISGTALSYMWYALQDHQMYIAEVEGEDTVPLPISGLHINSGQRYSVLIKGKTAAEVQSSRHDFYWMFGSTISREVKVPSMTAFYYPEVQRQPTQRDLHPRMETEDENSPEYEWQRYEAPPYNPAQQASQRNFDPSAYSNLYMSRTTGIIVPEHVKKDYNLKPYQSYQYGQDLPALQQVTRRIYLTAKEAFYWPNGKPAPAGEMTDTWQWALNGRRWSKPYQNVPTLMAMVSNNPADQQYTVPASDYYADPRLNGYGTVNSYHAPLNLYAANYGDVLELVIRNGADGRSMASDSHPFHMHGQHFYDIGSGPGDYAPISNEASLQSGAHNAIKRDTSVLYKYFGEDLNGNDLDDPNDHSGNKIDGWRAWRWRVTSVGTPMLHCHTLQHILMGMSAAFVMGTRDDIRTLAAPSLLVSGWDTRGRPDNVRARELFPYPPGLAPTGVTYQWLLDQRFVGRILNQGHVYASGVQIA